MKSAIEILEGTKKNILKGWTQRTNARTRHGWPTSPWDWQACSYCLEGALLLAADLPGTYWQHVTTPFNETCRTAILAANALRRVIEGMCPDTERNRNGVVILNCFNDAPQREKDHVLYAIDLAIAQLRAEETV